MQNNCKTYLALVLCAVVSGCGNNAGFTSSNGDNRIHGSDAIKADQGPQSEQDETPTRLPDGSPNSTTDGNDPGQDGSATDNVVDPKKKESQPESFKIEREF